MSALERSILSKAEARSLTDEVKGDAERLWRKLVELYEGTAHEVLGYESWRSYWIAEFGEQSLSLGYKQIAAGRVARVVSVDHGPQPNERQARHLAPLLDQPETLREAWAEVVDQHPEPTAAHVREVVERKRGPVMVMPLDEDLVEKQQRENLISALDRALFALEAPPDAAQAQAQQLLAAGNAGPFTPSRFERVAAYSQAFAIALREAGIDG